MTSADGSPAVVPDIPYVRRGDGERRATYFELFFDLVYVFAVTQLSHHLVGELTWAGAAQTAFLLLAVYWAWNYTTWMANWFDPEVAAVRLVLVFVMLASLLMAVAIPDAFGDHALLFAASYCALQVVRNGFVVAVTPAGAFNHNFRLILIWSMASVPLWIAGAVAHGGARWAWWLAALALDLAGPLVRYWVPGMGRSPVAEWAIDPGHFAERFQLFVIIVLGESIVITGATASGSGLDGPVIAALVCAFVSTVALWWLYFGQVAGAAARRIAADDLPGRTGRDAYTYLHLPIVAGVLLSAVGDELVLAHPGDPLGWAGALVALGGPALYLLGLVAFGRRVGRPQPWTRPAAVVLMAAAVAPASRADGLLVAALTAALLAALVVADRRYAATVA
ncbi:MAG TPA: low temperature requirement protein A [Acidimicrobiales bacterium]